MECNVKVVKRDMCLLRWQDFSVIIPWRVGEKLRKYFLGLSYDLKVNVGGSIHKNPTFRCSGVTQIFYPFFDFYSIKIKIFRKSCHNWFFSVFKEIIKRICNYEWTTSTLTQYSEFLSSFLNLRNNRRHMLPLVIPDP